MNENKETSMNQNEQKRKRGRPRKQRNYILYRSGLKLKAYNTDLGIAMTPTQADLSGNVTIYDGLGEDYVAWGRRLTREGYYNTASRFPFRKTEGEIDNVVPGQLEEDFRNCKPFPRFVQACTDLFEGRIPHGTVILEGVYWMRVLSHVFVREAGVEGISRMRFERPEGKVWTSVCAKRAWYSVVNMIHPPTFVVKITRAKYESATDRIPESWDPSSLANAILHGLWATKGVNSRATDDPKVRTVAQEPAVTPEAAPLSRCRSCGRVLEFDWGSGVCFECEQKHKAEAAAEADPTTRRCNICGSIMQGVFADRTCTRCAATVNVEADE
jgi:hypothetical protein